MPKKEKKPPENCPVWFDGTHLSEPLYCREFLKNHQLIFSEGAFFTPEGRMQDDAPLREVIFAEIHPYVHTGVPNKIKNIIEVLKITAYVPEFPPEEDRIHLANGTLFLDGSFDATGCYVVRTRLSVAYNPDAPDPVRWKAYIEGLFWPEDIVNFQEFVGYCLLPTNKAQRMMIIKGSGGEGKSQAGTVLKKLFGINAKDGSVGKVSENQFARADLEHIHLMIDDDMRMEALKQTNYVKSLVTANGKMDLEMKSKQSYQGHMFARLLAFSNGDLQSLYDRSDGFYRIEHTNNVYSVDGRRVWGFRGIKLMLDSGIRSRGGFQRVNPNDNPFS